MPRDAISLSRSELPEEIEKAIESLIDEAKYEGGRFSASDGKDIERVRSALTVAILSRLGEAEARREEAEKQRDRARRGKEDDNAILREVMTENEQLRAANMKLQEIVAADDAKAIAKYEWERANLLAVGRDKAATARDVALARVERLENALAGAVNRLNSGKSAASDWLYVVNEAGDLEVEMPVGFVAEPHAALSEAPPQGEQ